ncbi:MAG: hypothetical protein G3M70_10135 [Candidatus Nitronauta litoralis]|uniref:Immunity protein 26 of polymorphic toxin system n=1 Tax=Candidatus Nitronauta litoralis TaxID=2705533 RepID=A0A7T0G0B7_9BACT|nr:MAG: hypothetical protein G3M70_10135 [Candidatus Nitronauta litoralis]
MPKKTLNYSEGDCFSVPLSEGGYARGVVARMDGSGGIFGYFFGPKVEQFKKLVIDENIFPENAVLLGQFGDLGFLEKKWEVIGRVSEWSREKWPMPLFLRFEEGSSVGYLSQYDENTLKIIGEQEVEIKKIDKKKYPKDSLMGYGFVEKKIEMILSS